LEQQMLLMGGKFIDLFRLNGNGKIKWGEMEINCGSTYGRFVLATMPF
jgi:hypothetical protein